MEVQPYNIAKDIVTFYIQADNFPEGITETFMKLSEITGGFEDREVFGISELTGGKMVYRACVKEQYAGEGVIYQLPYYTIPKGNYIATLLTNWREHLSEINGIFGRLMQHPDAKTNSIVLEYYKNEKEAWLMLEMV